MQQGAQNYCVSYMWLHIYLKSHKRKLVSIHAFLRSGPLIFRKNTLNAHAIYLLMQSNRVECQYPDYWRIFPKIGVNTKKGGLSSKMCENSPNFFLVTLEVFMKPHVGQIVLSNLLHLGTT